MSILLQYRLNEDDEREREDFNAISAHICAHMYLLFLLKKLFLAFSSLTFDTVARFEMQ